MTRAAFRVLVPAMLMVALCGALLSVTRTAHAQQKYWVEFRDKSIADFGPISAAYQEALSRLSPEARHRRERNGARPVTMEDARISSIYLDSLSTFGIIPLHESRWLNAISAELSQVQYDRLKHSPYVICVRPLAHSQPLSTSAESSAEQIVCSYDPIASHAALSLQQLQRINVMPLVAMGLDASAVRLGFMDTGFRWSAMSSLASANVDREYDYVFHDSTTANEPGDVPDQDNHGSGTLAAAAGYEMDAHLGPAHNATLFLAKTEDLRSETNVEEDNYAQALENMEAWGVDVTSSSLGYLTFDSDWRSYSYADLNGRTSICAQAAVRAARLGVLVVTAIGNNGALPEPHMITPGDADSIITVGGLDELNNHVGFSSVGPTSDGRIKPDICAPAVGVHSQAADGHYDYFGGTSFATPLVSGACCLLRQAHPRVPAQRLIEAIHRTGSNAARPDTLLGWGVLNAYAAALDAGDILHEMNASYDKWLELCVGASSKFGISNIEVEYTTRTDGTRSQHLYLAADSLIYSTQLSIEPNTLVRYRYALRNRSGEVTYFPDTGLYEFQTGAGHELVIDVFPNPVAEAETILSNEPGSWSLYDATGRSILEGKMFAPGKQSFSVHGLANGSYFLVMRSNAGEVVTRKLFVVH